MAITPFMLLDLPTPEVTLGPEWAQKIIEALEKIDSHDHSTDQGTDVTPAGITVNADLPFGGYQATNVKALALAQQLAVLASSFVGCVYRVGDNLYYNNGSGTPVQITSGSSLATPGSGIFTIYVPPSYPASLTSSQAQTVVSVDTSAARTINLPAATNAMHVIIKDSTGSAGSNTISIAPNASDTIDGSNSTFTLNWAYGSVGLISDGASKWLVI